jgi:hypothetical protein
LSCAGVSARVRPGQSNGRAGFLLIEIERKLDCMDGGERYLPFVRIEEAFSRDEKNTLQILLNCAGKSGQ